MTIEYVIPEDRNDQSHYESLTLTIDDDGDLWVGDRLAHLMLSYAQAKALHYSLGQAIIRFDRAFGAHNAYEIKEVSNG